MTTTVEGGETADQFAFSRDEECDFVQGFHVSRLLPADEFRRMLADVGMIEPPRTGGTGDPDRLA